MRTLSFIWHNWTKPKRLIWYLWLREVRPRIHLVPVVPSSLPIDVLIVAIDRDIPVLIHTIVSVRNYIQHPIGDIVIVAPTTSAMRDICTQYGCEFIDERAVLPIIKDNIDYICTDGSDRRGWLYQQFLKWSGDKLLSGSHYLTIDADTVFTRTQVYERAGKIIYNCCDEYHQPYFDIYRRLLYETAQCPLSFTSHQMLFDRAILDELKTNIEWHHHCVWYQAIINLIDHSTLSGHSDYETYAQYVYAHHRNSMQIEYWFNQTIKRQDIKRIGLFQKAPHSRTKTISFHYHNH
jgi:hypothetical protein